MHREHWHSQLSIQAANDSIRIQGNNQGQCLILQINNLTAVAALFGELYCKPKDFDTKDNCKHNEH